MPIAKLDDVSALLVIDLQKGIVSLPTAHSIDQVVKNVTALASTWRAKRLPVVLVNVAGNAPGRTDLALGGGKPPPDWTDLIPELNRQPEDHLVTKHTWGAFTNTGLADHLKKSGVTQVVIAGVATSLGIESTARHAHELGFHVVIPTDAITDMSADAHANSIERVLPMLGQLGTTADILALASKA